MCLNHQEEISDRFVLVTLGYRHIDDLKSFTVHTDNLPSKEREKDIFYHVLNGNKTTSSSKTKSFPNFSPYIYHPVCGTQHAKVNYISPGAGWYININDPNKSQ